MQRFGWTNPILVDEQGEIIAGHGRVLAAQLLTDSDVEGWTQAPVMIARDWSEEERAAYRIADNKLPMNADWNMAMLSEELLALDHANFDMTLLGFNEAELANVLAPVGELNRDAEWRGMPEYSQEQQLAHRTLLVHFRNDADVAAFAELVGQRITDGAKYIWHPAAEIERVQDKRVLSSES